MRIFISGASSFIGGAITKKLQSNHEVVAITRSRKNAEKIMALGANAVNCSLATVTPYHLAGCDVAIHTAALDFPTGSRQKFWKANVDGTKRFLAAACVAGVRRFIYISSEAVLFRGQDMVDVDESYPYPSETPFLEAASKAEAERLVMEANDPDSGFSTIILRPRLVWGPGDDSILPFMRMARNGRFFWFNNGQARTSTTHIDNVVYAIELALRSRVGGQPYFITDDEVWTMKDFLSAYAAIQGLTLPDRSLPAGPMKVVGRFLGGIWRQFGLKSEPPLTEYAVALMAAECTLKIDNARNDLGYRPRLSVAEGLADMITLTERLGTNQTAPIFAQEEEHKQNSQRQTETNQ